MLQDTVTITIQSGNGGHGSLATLQLRPDGGDGGNGGDVFLKGEAHLYGFRSFIEGEKYSAKNGEDGRKGDKHGSRGEDLVLSVPLTTEVEIDGETEFIIDQDQQLVKILPGGKGTLGTVMLKKYKIKTDQANRDTSGQTQVITLVLKIKSDVIFIGYPNAGKSSMLTALTNAKAKADSYAFTTLEPQLGRMDGLRLLDLPGLIDDAHEGKGLGTGFVKHTKYSKMIAHFVSLESEDPVKQYQAMREELQAIDVNLAEKPEVVLLTKYDEVSPDKRNQVEAWFTGQKVAFVTCSILDDDSLQKVRKLLKERFLELAAVES